jgi:molybdate transport system substrate-binding protein
MAHALVRWLALAVLLLTAPLSVAKDRGPLVLAAASLQESLNAAADAWAASGHARPVLSFASTAVLARQIEAGAPADLFFSADDQWTQHLAAQKRLRAESRHALLGNRLVLIVPASNPLRLQPAPGFALSAALGRGRLAMADPQSVPAGKYAAQALTRLGIWASVKDRVVRAENVRAAMALVERRAAPLGIVYATDARASAEVRVAGVFPASSHRPIRYEVALLAASTHADAAAFHRFLLSKDAQAIFRRYGFGTRLFPDQIELRQPFGLIEEGSS